MWLSDSAEPYKATVMRPEDEMRAINGPGRDWSIFRIRGNADNEDGGDLHTTEIAGCQNEHSRMARS